MTEYENAMLRLKLLELTQRQSILAIVAHDKGPEARLIATEGKVMLDVAVKNVTETLL